MRCAVPPGAQDLRQAAGVVAVGLVAHRLQRRGDLPRLQADDLEAGLAQAVGEVLRQRAGLEADLANLIAKAPQRCSDDVNLGSDLRLEPDRARLVDHADRR